jgi:hypothetical protein
VIAAGVTAAPDPVPTVRARREVSPGAAPASRRAKHSPVRHLREERRLGETPRAALRFDRVADVVFRLVDALAARRTDEGVVVQCRDDRDPAAPGEGGQIERQVEQAVDVQDVRIGGFEHLLEGAHQVGRAPRGGRVRIRPVVDDLDDR